MRVCVGDGVKSGKQSVYMCVARRWKSKWPCSSLPYLFLPDVGRLCRHVFSTTNKWSYIFILYNFTSARYQDDSCQVDTPTYICGLWLRKTWHVPIKKRVKKKGYNQGWMSQKASQSLWLGFLSRFRSLGRGRGTFYVGSTRIHLSLDPLKLFIGWFIWFSSALLLWLGFFLRLILIGCTCLGL